MTAVTDLSPIFGHAADLLAPPDYRSGHQPLDHFAIPDHLNWSVLLREGGRGAAKSYSTGGHFDQLMMSKPGVRGRITAPTFTDLVASCIDGPSGVLDANPAVRFYPSRPGGATLVWPNGGEVICFGVPTKRDVDRYRATGNRDLDWFEELCAFPYVDESLKQASAGRRLSTLGKPLALVSTTPRPSAAYKALRERATTLCQHGTMWDNPHLSDEWKAELVAEYGDTSLARQELYGEMLEQADGALWTFDMIEQTRLHDLSTIEFELTCIGVDPASGTGTTGIIGAGAWRDEDGAWHIAALADGSLTNKSPAQWGQKSWALFDEYDCDANVIETNQGGDMATSTLTQARPAMKRMIAPVRASKSKQARAHPLALMFEQGRGHIAGSLPFLEAELTSWEPDSGMESPDRLDAFVWAATWLMGRFARRSGGISEPKA